MTRLTIATLAAGAVMGQQVYEEAIVSRASAALGTRWDVRSCVVRTLRSPLAGTARLPSYVLGNASLAVRRSAGTVLYRGSDVVHRMDLRLPPASKHEVITIHDVVSWRFPDEGRPPRPVLDEAKQAAVVVCPSAFSAAEIADVLGVREPVVIHNGVDPELFHAAALSDAELAELGVRPPFVLHAGGCTQRKNLAALAQAWAMVQRDRPDTQLVLVGPPDRRRTGLFAPLPATKLLGRVDRARLRGLMHTAAALVVPSVYEGFGLPALEGMACGIPVVAARASSLPEVCGDAALLVSPDADGLAEGLEAVLGGGSDVRDLAQRGPARARRFSWDESARRHAELWRALAG